MKIIEPKIEVQPFDALQYLKDIEHYGRVCYKTEPKGFAASFVKKLIAKGHLSVLEHKSITVVITCDRGVSHELVRHRIAAYSQESTRYCNYSKDKFSNELTFIRPCFWAYDKNWAHNKNMLRYNIWEEFMLFVEKRYMQLIASGASPQEARSILPNSLATTIVATMNLRQWRHMLKQRTAPACHPQMIQIAIMILTKFKELLPIVFEDIND